jgi:methionyl-tRNA synthetase
MAKDIIRFHCIIWEAMLLSAGYELPKKIFAHGFLTVDGQKMSKSLGNVIDPLYLSEKYSVDSLRYFLLREIPFGEDGDFSERALRARLNSELADVFGNFVHRTLTFIWTNFDGRVPKGEMDKKLQHKVDRKIKRIKKDLDDLKLHAGLEEIMSMAKAGNEHFQHSEPWRRIKEDKKRASDCLFSCVQLVKDLCILLYPFIPATCDDLAEQINIKIKSLEQINEPLPPGHRINKPKPLFKKVMAEPEKVVETKMISQKDFSKLDLRVAKVKQVERLGRNLLKIELDLADRIMTTVAGIGNAYEEKDLVGKQVVIVANLEPKTIAGVKSECMLLAVDAKKPVLIVPEKEVGAGLRVF